MTKGEIGGVPTRTAKYSDDPKYWSLADDEYERILKERIGRSINRDLELATIRRALEKEVAADSKASLGGLAESIKAIYGPGSAFDEERLAQERKHAEWLKKMAATSKSPAERERLEKRKVEEAKAAEKKVGPLATAMRGGKTGMVFDEAVMRGIKEFSPAPSTIDPVTIERLKDTYARMEDYPYKVYKSSILSDDSVPAPSSPVAPAGAWPPGSLATIEKHLNSQDAALTELGATIKGLLNVVLTLRERLDLIDSTVLNIQSAITKEKQ